MGALGVAGSSVLAFVGLFYASGFAVAIFAVAMGAPYTVLLGQVGAISLIWFLTKFIKRVRFRLPLRAIALSLAFTPFIPHPGVEWALPWPPAVFFLAVGLAGGGLALFELTTILGFAVVIWLASLAVHRDLARGQQADPCRRAQEDRAEPER